MKRREQMRKRIVSFLLAVCTAVTLLAVPAGASVAAAATFSDLSDRDTAAAVESLRLLGVLDGYADGTFRPGRTLTRAQFCKMAVYALGAGDQLGQYRTVTVFQDVKPSYWAAPYINLASKGKSIIAGYPNGKFQPDNSVTYGQAVTILVRMLGYQDSDIGGIWPEGYLAEAGLVGLTDGVSSTGSAPLTRAQAAVLFTNLLRCNTKDGGNYAATLGTTVADVMLVSSAASASDGTSTAMESGSGTVYSMAYKASSGLLNGFKGTLILNKQGKVLTFVPDSLGTSRTVTVASATSAKLTTITGESFSVDSDVSVYLNGKEQEWTSAYTWLNAGSSVTLYLNAAGGVEYVFAGGGTASDAAVIVYANASTVGFDALAGGSGYAIYKDGVKASAADLRPYDVATYSAVTGAVRVCDTRVTGYYEDCSPNTAAPETVTLLGHTFNVLPTAMDTLSKFKLGQQITLLLTEDNQVAGAVEAVGAGVYGNAVGVVRAVSTASATVDLLCGISVTGTVSLSEDAASQLKKQLVTVTSGAKGKLNLSGLSGGVPGDLDVVNRKLGTVSLSDNVMIWESSASGMTAASLAKISTATVSASRITCARKDWSGKISLLVMNNVTASDYLFGRIRYTPANPGEGTAATICLETGNSVYTATYDTAYIATNGEFAGIRINAAGTGINGLMHLTKQSNVSNGAWVGATAVMIDGRTYPVAEDVLCYNKSSGNWLTLSAARAFAGTANLYTDTSGIVRVVEVS